MPPKINKITPYLVVYFCFHILSNSIENQMIQKNLWWTPTASQLLSISNLVVSYFESLFLVLLVVTFITPKNIFSFVCIDLPSSNIIYRHTSMFMKEPDLVHIHYTSHFPFLLKCSLFSQVYWLYLFLK